MKINRLLRPVAISAFFVAALGILAVGAGAGCSGKTVPAGGLELIIATNLNAPMEFDTLRIEVSQEISPGQWGTPLLANDFRVPEEATLPTTVAIAAGKNADQNARIRVIALKGTNPQVLREVEIQVPTQRVAALKLVLADPCLGQVRVDDQMMVQSTCPDPSQSCQPDTGACGPNFVDPATLPDYVPGDEQTIDAGMRDTGPGADGPVGAPSPPSNVAASTSLLTTFAGSVRGFAEGTGTAAQFNAPYGLAVDASGNVYVGDEGNHRIRKITPGGMVTTLAGSGASSAVDGPAAVAGFDSPAGIAVDPAGNLYVVDTYNNNVRKVTAAGVVSTLAGGIVSGFADGIGGAAKFQNPIGAAVDGAGNVYVGDNLNNRIRMVTPGGVVTTFAGSATQGAANGTGAAASFNAPVGLAMGPGGDIFVADSGNSNIRKTTSAGVVTTLAGTGTFGFVDGIGTAAAFHTPFGVAVDAQGNVFVADSFNDRIRKVTAAGVVTTLAGSGFTGNLDGAATAGTFSDPLSIAVDTNGNVYVGDLGNNRIRKVAAAGSGNLAVSWTAPAGSLVTGYMAYATVTGVSQSCSTTGATYCVISGLTAGTPYTISVTATNAAGTSAPSSAVMATPN